MKIKILNPKISLPRYQTPGSLGVDLQAAIEHPICLKPGARELIPTGIAIELEEGVGAFLFARSGCAHNSGLMLSNGVGVIDSDYRGEIKASILNTREVACFIYPLASIAQLVFMPVITESLVVSETIGGTQRGEGGFGSTDKIDSKAPRSFGEEVCKFLNGSHT